MKYVAFLRGINVGGRIIKMTDLKACFKRAGLQNVSTILQTGNVVFESQEDDLKSKIETAITGAFNYPAKVQLIEISKLEQIVKNYPFDRGLETTQHYVIFMENGLEKDLIENSTTDSNIEETKLGEGVVYWKVQKGMTTKSTFSKFLTKTNYQEFNTNRNINTLNKILLSS